MGERTRAATHVATTVTSSATPAGATITRPASWGGYGRDSHCDYGQRSAGGQDYGQRDYGRSDYGRSEIMANPAAASVTMAGPIYGQRDYGNQRSGQAGGWGGSGWGGDRQRFTGGSDYYRGDQDRQAQGQHGRDTYRQSRGTFDRQPQNYGRDDDRGFFERAGDEVRSWFGDEDAERRREQDARNYERGDNRGSYSRDEHYHSWRNQQIAAFDRDYDEYRNENQSKFHNEFSSFRTERQGQRDLLNKVEEHQEVVGSDGSHVGTVDKVRGDRIILTKSDQDAGGHHHSIPSRWLQSADGGKLTLRKTADEAKAHWRDEERQQSDRGAMFGKDQPRTNELRSGPVGRCGRYVRRHQPQPELLRHLLTGDTDTEGPGGKRPALSAAPDPPFRPGAESLSYTAAISLAV